MKEISGHAPPLESGHAAKDIIEFYSIIAAATGIYSGYLFTITGNLSVAAAANTIHIFKGVSLLSKNDFSIRE